MERQGKEEEGVSWLAWSFTRFNQVTSPGFTTYQSRHIQYNPKSLILFLQRHFISFLDLCFRDRDYEERREVSGERDTVRDKAGK